MRVSIVTVLVFASFQSLDCLKRIPSNSRLNFFDIDLLRFSAEDRRGNVMVSPASIKSMLGMLLEGAEGATATEIRTALRLSPIKEDFREELHLFMRALQTNTSSVTLNNANGLFVSKKLQLKATYEMMAKRMYFTEVNKMDFSHPVFAADMINDWVNAKTRGLIPSIIDQVNINPTTELLVTNALYFKGAWQYQFQPSLTRGECFYRDGVCKKVAMMDLQAELNYAYVKDLRAHALELPYEGGRYSMLVLVPQDRDSGVALIRDLPYIGLLQISNLLEPTDVMLTMPKFTVEYSDDMVGTLRSMRISSLFSPSANLSRIFEGTSAYLSSIYHTVYMSVDEKGTVAAAASAGMVVPLIYNQVQLRVDRPFLFFIRDNDLGLLLFEGKIEEPMEYVPVNNRLGENENKSVPTQPISTKPISTIDQPTSTINQPQSAQPAASAPNPTEKAPIQPVPIEPFQTQPVSSSPPQIKDQQTNYQPSTTPATRRTTEQWYKKIFG